MAIQSRNKINLNFSMSGMADIIFLLLIFFMLTSTLIAPNALKLLLPKSNNQTTANPVTSVSITKELNYYVGMKLVTLSQLEGELRKRLKNEEDPFISLHVDHSVPMKEVVNVMNIAKNNQYKLILATRPE